jgi:hypothetical protein
VGAVDADALGPKKVPVPITNPLQVSFQAPPPTGRLATNGANRFVIGVTVMYLTGMVPP